MYKNTNILNIEETFLHRLTFLRMKIINTPTDYQRKQWTIELLHNNGNSIVNCTIHVLLRKLIINVNNEQPNNRLRHCE